MEPVFQVAAQVNNALGGVGAESDVGTRRLTVGPTFQATDFTRYLRQGFSKELARARDSVIRLTRHVREPLGVISAA